jgi:hypothetical protein
MVEDPKNPNAWWAVRLPSLSAMASMFLPRNLSGIQKRRLYLVFIVIAIIGSVEIFYLNRLMK